MRIMTGIASLLKGLVNAFPLKSFLLMAGETTGITISFEQAFVVTIMGIVTLGTFPGMNRFMNRLC